MEGWMEGWMVGWWEGMGLMRGADCQPSYIDQARTAKGEKVTE
jgi:hypothetical protein